MPMESPRLSRKGVDWNIMRDTKERFVRCHTTALFRFDALLKFECLPIRARIASR